ncbi:MAG: hypothetical protein DCF25_14680 [Leptolyngbya foveolarum]|uniref:DUF86 domain-containing protein n=1 Tax=Leptolyngbya foveolarum TaxID=47253 RepID=A0A2W4W680_9CYAN|nr:MAG: hypothetical protein DCF25_14680 [Leptolyngbya foveolarum]
MPRDLHSLFDIVHSAELVVQYTNGVLEEDFSTDEQLQDATIRRLLVIGEAAGRISEAGRNELSTIDWPKIRGLRNRLVHEYDNISLEIVWAIAQTEMTDLVSKIKPLLPTEDQLSTEE